MSVPLKSPHGLVHSARGSGRQRVNHMLSCSGADCGGRSVQGSQVVQDIAAQVRGRLPEQGTGHVDGRVRSCPGHGQAVARRRPPRAHAGQPRQRASSVRQGPDSVRPPKRRRPIGSSVGEARFPRRTLKMSIRDSYIPTFGSIKNKYGAGYSGPKIRTDASLKRAIGYAREYVVKHSQQHFRYDYYQKALSSAFRRLRFDPAGRRIVHLDMGCGPGLFSWVMHDHIESEYAQNVNSVSYFGYDHAAAMIRLAHLFWDRLPVRCDFDGYSSLDEIAAVLTDRDFSNHDVVVTFGYVLVQVQDSTSAMDDFAALTSCLFPTHSCLMVAADAHNDSTVRSAFRDQCAALQAALSEVGVRVRKKALSSIGSVMSAGLDME